MASRGSANRKPVFLIAAAGAAVVLGIFYYWGGAPTIFDLARVLRGGDRIAPGFIGVAEFGHWRLICVQGPPPLDGLTAARPPLAVASTNACRVNGEMPAPAASAAALPAAEPPKLAPVLVSANFSLVGAMKRPAVMVRLPPTARPGDKVGLRFDDDYRVGTAIRDCTPQQCIAAGALTGSDWSRLVITKALQISFPAADRQDVLVDLPVDGLMEAVAALARAQTQTQTNAQTAQH